MAAYDWIGFVAVTAHFPDGFSGPWCVGCCLPRLDLDIDRSDSVDEHAECATCGATEIEWSD